jgi:uncharacterized paraquat-inducible protein A
MGRHSVADADYEDDDDDGDFEAPEAFDRDDSDEDDDTVKCGRCGREISAMAEQCPRCGTYVSEEDAPTSSFPKWAVITAALVLAAMAAAMLRGIF